MKEVWGRYYRGPVIDPYSHRVEIPPDDGKDITFRWHFPRGTLAPRMSGMELGMFILAHMPHIIPLLAAQPRAQREFEVMYLWLATDPKASDELLPWIQSVTRMEDDDVIVMQLGANWPVAPGPMYSIPK